MGGRRILSDAQIAEMCELREKGWGCGRIARHFTRRGTPVSQGSINWQCLREGADAPPGMRRGSTQRTTPVMRGGHLVRPFSNEEDRRLIYLEGKGVNYSEIARTLGRMPNSIRGRLYTLARREARAEDIARFHPERVAGAAA